MTVEQALRTVERTARESVEWPAPPAVPRKYRMHVNQRYRPLDYQVDALEDLEAALTVDLRFEHMKEREIKEATEDFANAAFVHRDADHIPGCLAKHAEEPHSLVCSFPIEGLTLHDEIELFGVTFTPTEEAEIPMHMLGPGQGPIGAVVSTTCEGTNGKAMQERARKKVEHALRQLRAGLREHRMIPDQQLRFRLGTSYWFDGGGGGWSAPSDQIINVGLNEELVELATSTRIAELPAEGGTSIEQAARRHFSGSMTRCLQPTRSRRCCTFSSRWRGSWATSRTSSRARTLPCGVHFCRTSSARDLPTRDGSMASTTRCAPRPSTAERRLRYRSQRSPSSSGTCDAQSMNSLSSHARKASLSEGSYSRR